MNVPFAGFDEGDIGSELKGALPGEWSVAG